MASETLLEVDGLSVHIPSARGLVEAVDGVSFSLDRGEVIGIVGESGCGKSMLALSLMRLVPEPGRIVGGRVMLAGRDLVGLPERADAPGARRRDRHDLPGPPPPRSTR